MKNRIKKYWETKSTFAKFSDAFFLIFVVAMLFPQGRLAIGGAINRIKAMVVEPSISQNRQAISEKDFNWEIQNIQGDILNINNSKGKVIFINLWATWCPPCVGEMPEIQNLYNTFKQNDKIDFYLITNENTNKIKAFINKRNYSFPVFHSNNETPIPFRSNSIPTTFVISKSGEIVIKETGAANWGGDKMVEIINTLINE